MTVNIQLSDRQLGGEPIKTCNGRELYAELGVSKDYTSWAKAQIKRGRFVENRDFVLFTRKGEQLASGAKWMTEYHFTIDAGKHIGMMSNTARGFEVREYFIACERTAKGLPPTPRIAYSVGPTDTLTKDEGDQLRDLLTNSVKQLPHDQQAKAMTQGWSKLMAHFKVSYRKIPRHEFTEALSIVARHLAAFQAKPLALPAPRNDAALQQALDSMHLMAGSVADLAAAMVNLTNERTAEARGSPPRRSRKVEAETLGPVSASANTTPSKDRTSHVEC